MAHLHDSGYKYLFSHAELVQELLEAFAPPGVSALLDYTTLRLENGNYVTPAMQPRADDIVWSVELQGQRIYLYLLLEFQSTPDDSMPARTMASRTTAYSSSRRAMRSDLRLPGWALSAGALPLTALLRPDVTGRVGSMRDSPELSGCTGARDVFCEGKSQLSRDMGNLCPEPQKQGAKG